jgi:acetylornithine/succinyldiaminopimelate/putrescine aminotransferase
MRPLVQLPIPGPRSRAWTRRSDAVEAHELTGGAQNPSRIFWERGNGANITDVDGNIFLDLTSAFGVSICGHAPNHLQSALKSQAELLTHSMGDLFPSSPKIELQEEILRALNLSSTDWACYVTTSGSDCLDLAYKLISQLKPKQRVIALQSSYHGQTLGALPFTQQSDLRSPFIHVLAENVDFVTFPEDQKGNVHNTIEELNQLLSTGNYSAIFFEPIQGLSGYRFIDPAIYEVFENIRSTSGLLFVADEIFCGMCRAESWSVCRQANFEPDLLCLGKALGGGVPVGALVARRRHWASVRNQMGSLPLHGSTFAGDPLVCAGALANIRWLVAHRGDVLSQTLGGRIRKHLIELESKCDRRIAVRGKGALWAIEFHEEARLTARRKTLACVSACLNQGVIVVQTGFPIGNVIGIAPPLVIDDEDLKFSLDVLSRAVGAVV